MKHKLTCLVLFACIMYANAFTQSVITSFTPTSGAIGTTVVIKGENFNVAPANNIVYFGAVRALVSAATATSLTVTAPAGATYQPISVLNKATGLTAYSILPFIVTFASGDRGLTKKSFADKVNFTTESSPEEIAMGDLDGDGLSDIVVANYSSKTISVFRNTGRPGIISFAPKADYPTAINPTAISIGDFDGDGKLDIAVSNEEAGFGSPGKISIFRNMSNKGTVSFSAKVDYATAGNSRDISIGDLDGDGKPDIAVTNYSFDNISVFRNTSISGNISFDPKKDYSSGGFNIYPLGIVIGDVDKDDKPDIAVANGGSDFSSSNVSILKNRSISGNISFDEAIGFYAGYSPAYVAMGDLDGDGKLDLAVTDGAFTHEGSRGSIITFKNLSNTKAISFTYANTLLGTTEHPNELAIGNLDGDNKPDIVVTSNSAWTLVKTVSAFENTSTNDIISFTAKDDYLTGDYPENISLGDLDGDGKSEIAVGKSLQTFCVLRNRVAPCVLNTSAIASSENNLQEQSKTNLFFVYPNPARDILHVQTNGNESFSLLSQPGQILLTTNINGSGSINIEGMAAGLYYLKNNSTGAVKKVIITR